MWHPEFAIEAALIGAFMVSAVAFTVLMEHPASPAADLAPPLGRRFIVALGMACTAVVLIYSRWGMRSGAHMNPAVTLAFARIGKVPRSAVPGYIAAQFTGATAGVGLAWLLFGGLASHPSVRFAVTVPGPWGPLAAFSAEAVMTAVQMAVVLAVSGSARFRPHAGLLAVALLVVYITFEAPVSGMSLNPARTFGSALWAREFTAIWIYFSAPVLGMLLAAELVAPKRPEDRVT